MSVQKITFEESDEIVIPIESTISQLGKQAYAYASNNLRKGLYGPNGNLVANLMLKIDFLQPGLANFTFKLPLSDKSHKQLYCKVSIQETLSAVMPDMCEAILSKMNYYNPTLVKSTPLSLKDDVGKKKMNVNASTFMPAVEQSAKMYPTIDGMKNKQLAIIPTAPPLTLAGNDQNTEEVLSYEQPFCDEGTEDCNISDYTNQTKALVPRASRSVSKRSEILPDDEPPVYTVARAPSIGRNNQKRAATLNITNSDGTKTILDVSGHLDASNIAKSIENIKQATNTKNTKTYLDKSQKKEIYEKTINKNRYSGDFSSTEKRSIFKNGESSGKRKNATVDNSLKSGTRIGNRGGSSYCRDDDD